MVECQICFENKLSSKVCPLKNCKTKLTGINCTYCFVIFNANYKLFTLRRNMMTPLITVFAFTIFFIDNIIIFRRYNNKGFIFYYFEKLFNRILVHENTIIPFFLSYVITTIIRKTIPAVPVEVLIITVIWLMQYTR